MDIFQSASSTASVSVSATSPAPGLVDSSMQSASGTKNPLAIENRSDDLTNETEDTDPSAKRSKKLTSDVWDHYIKYEVTKEDKDGNKVVEKWARCKSSGCTYKGRRSTQKGNRGTTVFRTHLQNKHHITTGQQKIVMEKVEGKEYMAAPATFKYDEAVSLRLFYLAIIMHEYPFNIVEHDYLVKFIHSLRPSFPIKSRHTANLFFISFCKIKIAISEWCASSDPIIKSMAFSMKLKYEKYWDKSNMALAVACFFDPRYKRNVIEYYAPRIYPTTYAEEIEKFTRVVDQLFEAYVLVSKKTTPSSGNNMCQNSSHNAFVVDDGLDSFLNSKRKISVRGIKTELELYMEQDLVPRTENGFNILSWWKDNQVEYPILSKLVRDILSIQVSTVASESAFSAGGRVVDPFRSRLDPETVQALICTKDWIAALEGGDIKSVLKDLDMESLERRFATMVHMLEEQPDDDSDDWENLMNVEEEE